MVKYVLILFGVLVSTGCLGCKFGSDGNLLLHGRVELDEIHIGSKITGSITSLTIQEGDQVKKGDLLGYLDNYDKKKNDFERASALFKSGAIPKDQLELAEIAFRDQSIIAPIDGVIMLRAKQAGETVSPGQTIVTVGNLKDVYAKVYVSEKDMGKIRVGGKARIKVDSFPDKEYEGKVIYISDTAEFSPKNVQTEEERARRVYAVKIKTENPNDELKPGMSCDAIMDAVK